MSARHGGSCTCRYCTPALAPVEPAVPEPIQMPDRPTPIRVHTPGLRPQDCTLHPDGTLTAVMGGELRRNYMSFDDMRERDWKHARIEFNPPPLAEEPEPEAEPVQDAIPLTTP